MDLKDVQKNGRKKTSSQFYRDTWIEINLSNIAYNIKTIKTILSTDQKIFAVVKANAYGHGDIQVSRAAISAGADALAVALLDEAIKLRHQGFKVPILVLGWTRPQDSPLAASLDISVTVFQKQWMEEVKKYELKNKLKVHLKIDSGMGRIGVRTKQQLYQMFDQLKDQRFELEGVFTHFATADKQQSEYFIQQKKIFKQFVDEIRSKWPKKLIIHSGNSAATLRCPSEMYDYVRPGTSMYGLYPSKFVQKLNIIQLKQAMFLYSRLVHVKLLGKGQSVSYGRLYITSGDQWIGSIPIGYGDGFNRRLRGQQVIIQGKKMPIVGTICMDQMMVKLDKQYPVGTKVTLVGQQGNQKISIEDIADKLQTINLEVFCMFTSRIPRIYVKDQNNGYIH